MEYIEMKEKLYTIPLNDAVNASDECPFCFIERELEQNSLDFVLGNGASTLARNKNYYKPQKCGLFYVKFYLFLCCTELYFIFICDIMRYETQL